MQWFDSVGIHGRNRARGIDAGEEVYAKSNYSSPAALILWSIPGGLVVLSLLQLGQGVPFPVTWSVRVAAEVVYRCPLEMRAMRESLLRFQISGSQMPNHLQTPAHNAS